jgi:hypothetical protein
VNLLDSHLKLLELPEDETPGDAAEEDDYIDIESNPSYSSGGGGAYAELTFAAKTGVV